MDHAYWSSELLLRTLHYLSALLYPSQNMSTSPDCSTHSLRNWPNFVPPPWHMRTSARTVRKPILPSAEAPSIRSTMRAMAILTGNRSMTKNSCCHHGNGIRHVWSRFVETPRVLPRETVKRNDASRPRSLGTCAVSHSPRHILFSVREGVCVRVFIERHTTSVLAHGGRHSDWPIWDQFICVFVTFKHGIIVLYKVGTVSTPHQYGVRFELNSCV